MRRKIKQCTKSIAAFGLALMLTWLPVCDVLPEVLAVEQGQLIIGYDQYVKDFQFCDNNGISVGESTHDTAGRQYVFESLNSGTYQLYANPTDEKLILQVNSGTGGARVSFEKDVIDTKDYKELPVSDEDVTNQQGEVDYRITTALASDQTFSVAFTDTEDSNNPYNGVTYISVTCGSDPLTIDANTGLYTVSANTATDTEVKVEFTLGAYKQPADSNIESADNKWVYTSTVGDVVIDKNGVISLGVKSVPVNAPEGTWTITSSGEGGYYGVSDFAEVTFTPNENNFLTGYTAYYTYSGKSDPEWEEVSLTGGKFTIQVGSGYVDPKDIKIKYVLGSTESSINTYDCNDAIKFDITGPVIGSVQEVKNVVTVAGEYWNNGKNQEQFPIYVVEITDVESGPKEVTYQLLDASDVAIPNAEGTVQVDDNKVEIPIKSRDATKISLTAKDKLGNETAGTVAVNIHYDTTNPTIDSITYEYANSSEAFSGVDKWQTQDVVVKIAASDVVGGTDTENSELENVVVYDTRDGNREQLTLTENAGEYSTTLSFVGVHNLEIWATDKAGNKSVVQTTTVKIDKAGISDPNVTLGSGITNCFAGAFDIKLTANTVSGLSEAEFVFHDNSGTEKSYVITAPAEQLTELSCPFPAAEFPNGFEGYVEVTYKDYIGNVSVAPIQKEFTYSDKGAELVVGAITNWTNQAVPVTVSAKDTFGGIQRIVYKVDGVEKEVVTTFTDPEAYVGGIQVDQPSSTAEGTLIEVIVISNSGAETSKSIRVYIDKQAPTVSLSGLNEGATYNTSRSLQITTKDNIWQAMQPVSVTATRSIDGTTTDMDLGSYDVESANDVATKTFTEDGVYEVTVVAKDAAGNTDMKKISFTIDRTAPVISMTGVTDGAYSSNPVTVNFQAVESFFDTNNVKITVERKLEGSTYGRTLTFTNTGKTSNMPTTFSEDGDYVITMSAVDRAGNVAEEKTISFTVDCTAPAVTLVGVEDYLITGKAVTLDFSVVESYYGTNKVTIQGSRRTSDGKVETINIMGWNNSGKTSAYTKEFAEDGYYTITISATDKAGNSKQQTIHFTIDTEAPVIGDLSAYDGKYLSTFRLKESLEELISELSVPSVKMTLNGEPYNGKEITEDGKYTLVIEVVDEVGLTATKTVEFVIDKTAPKVIFAGADNLGIYTTEVKLNIALENESDTITEILVNGVPYDLVEGQSMYDLNFSEYGIHEVIVSTIDAAGNENSQSIQFTYAEEKVVWLLYVIGGAVVVAAGLVVCLVVKAKKK